MALCRAEQRKKLSHAPWTIIETAKAENGLDPQAYLPMFLDRITITDQPLDELLPWKLGTSGYEKQSSGISLRYSMVRLPCNLDAGAVN